MSGQNPAVVIATPQRHITTNIFKFGETLGVDPKEWRAGECQMQRANNRDIVECHNPVQEFGEGSEFGKMARILSRRKKRGYSTAVYKADDQPWEITLPTTTVIKERREANDDTKPETKTDTKPKVTKGETGSSTTRRMRGHREGGTSDNCDYWIFRRVRPGQMEATLVDDWYNFVPVPAHRTLDIDEAEANFTRRDKIMNQFALKAQVIKADAAADRSDETIIKNEKSFVVKAEASSDSDVDDAGNDDEKAPSEKKVKSSKKKTKVDQEPKTEEELYKQDSSDGGEDGDEIDYMSDTDGESDTEPAKVVTVKKEVEEASERGDEAGVGDFFLSDSEESDVVEDEDDEEEEKKGDTQTQDANWTAKMGALANVTNDDDDDGSDLSDDPDAHELPTSSGMTIAEKYAKTAPKRAATEVGGTSSAKKARIAEITEGFVRRRLIEGECTTKDLVVHTTENYPDMEHKEIVTQLSRHLKVLCPRKKKVVVDGVTLTHIWLDA